MALISRKFLTLMIEEGVLLESPAQQLKPKAQLSLSPQLSSKLSTRAQVRLSSVGHYLMVLCVTASLVTIASFKSGLILSSQKMLIPFLSKKAVLDNTRKQNHLLKQ